MLKSYNKIKDNTVEAEIVPIEDEKDSAALMRAINTIAYEYQVHKNPYAAMDKAKSKFHAYR